MIALALFERTRNYQVEFERTRTGQAVPRRFEFRWPNAGEDFPESCKLPVCFSIVFGNNRIMDELDRKILRNLQRNSSQALQALADTVGLSPSACHRRIKLLEQNGAISGYRAELNPQVLGLTVEVLVQIRLTSQAVETLREFEEAVQNYREVLDCWLLAGEADYVLRVMAIDIEDYERIHRQCLSRLPGVSSMQSSFSLKRIKAWKGYDI